MLLGQFVAVLDILVMMDMDHREDVQSPSEFPEVEAPFCATEVQGCLYQDEGQQVGCRQCLWSTVVCIACIHLVCDPPVPAPV